MSELFAGEYRLGGRTLRRAQITRDPFGRWTLERQLVETRDGCTNCGGRRSSGRMFQYIIVQDSGRESPTKGVFCGIECHDSYHHR